MHGKCTTLWVITESLVVLDFLGHSADAFTTDAEDCFSCIKSFNIVVIVIDRSYSLFADLLLLFIIFFFIIFFFFDSTATIIFVPPLLLPFHLVSTFMECQAP